MKTIPLLFILIFTFSAFWISEPETFGRIYRQHGSIYSVQQTADNGFLLGSGDGIIKTNAFGSTEWQRLLGSRFSKIAIQNTNGNYLLAGVTHETIIPGVLDTLYIYTYSTTGDLIDKITLFQANQIFIFGFESTPDSGFILLVGKGNQGDILFIKLNENLETEWQSDYTPPGGFLFPPAFIQTSDSQYIVIGNKGELNRYNAFGDTVYTNRLTHKDYNSVTEINDSTFVLAGRHRVGIFDKNGIMINDKVFDDNIWFMHVGIDSNSNKIILCGRFTIAQLDFDLNVLWQETNEYFNFIDQIIDNEGNYLFAGEYYSPRRGFLLKSNTVGEYNYLSLQRPQEGYPIRISEDLGIQWATNLPGTIDLKYSTDNGNTWDVIVDNYPADSLYYQWKSPGVTALQFLIRIESVSNPQYYDQNISPLNLTRKDYDFIATDQIQMWFGNNGAGSQNPIKDDEGFLWPGGINATQSAIYRDGLCWGGWAADSLRVNGNTYNHGLVPGNIQENGKPADPLDPRFAIWRANPDWQSFEDGFEKDRLQYDINNWPVDLGAPWQDLDGNGQYDPQTDKPNVPGDDLYWMVMNDLGIYNSRYLSNYTWDTNPIGLEIQLSVYAYNQDILEDVVFKKYKVFNKGINQVDNMYFSYWSDPDLGFARNDYVGCDSVLDLAYCYNESDDDDIYESPVPAVGYVLLQGPIVPGDIGDDAYAFNSWIPGKKNLPMTSFIPYISEDEVFRGPECCNGGQFYNYMKGKDWRGINFVNPLTGKITKFALNGDPVKQTGWYEGDGWPDGPKAGSRRMIMNSGPFNFAPGDKQEIVIAVVIARGNNHLDSITELKKVALAVKEFYYTGELPTNIEDENSSQPPRQYSLRQNYPNPFNPTTMISYQLPMNNNVKLVVYDALGREVKTLVNKKQAAGKYQVTFDAKDLASGVYYYKLVVGETFKKTKKMLLLK